MQDQASSSSDASGAKTCWYMMGCVSKRPMCHIFGSLVSDTRGPSPRALVPRSSGKPCGSNQQGSWILQTSHEIFSTIAAEHAAELALGRKAPLKIDVFFYNYESVGMLQHPNHFVHAETPTCHFSIGTKEVVSKVQTPRAQSQTESSVHLGFGICFDPTAIPKTPTTTKGKGRGRGRGRSDGGKEKLKIVTLDDEIDDEGGIIVASSGDEADGGRTNQPDEPIRRKKTKKNTLPELAEVVDTQDPNPVVFLDVAQAIL